MMRVLPVLALCALLLGGCFSDDKDPAPVGQEDLSVAQRPITSDALTTHLHDLSVPVDGVDFASAIVEQYRTPVTELIELDTWIARPRTDEKVPIVLDVTPYYGGGAPTALGRVGIELITRGYAVGVSSVRGTGQSGGCFSQGGPDEAVDTAAVIEHLAGQEWSNGNVGLMGVSYDGTTPQDVWVEAPPSLKAIVPISGISDMYRYNFVHGVHIQPQGYAFNTYYWALEGPTAATIGDGDPQHSATAAAGEACPEQVDVQQGGASSALDGNKDAYWQVRDFGAELAASPEKNAQRAAVWYIHGLQDWNVKPHMMEDWLPAVIATGVPYKVWLGQWQHAWPASTGTAPESRCMRDDDGNGNPCRADWWSEGMVAWFDQFLKGRDTGILDAPRVQVQDDDGRWHHEQVWPPTEVARHVFYPTADGKLATMEGTGSVSYNDGSGAGGNPAGLLPVPALPIGATQVNWRSEPLTQEWTISGLPRFHANVTASGARASLFVTLAEELPSGELRSFNFCMQSLNHAANPANGMASVAGVRQEVEVACFPQDDVVHVGSRIVAIAAGNTVGGPGPGMTPLSSGSTIEVEMVGAWLELPVDHSIVYESPQPYVEDA